MGKKQQYFISGYFKDRTEEDNIESILSLKLLFNQIKKEFNIDCYLIYGTLLGAIRDKKFIEYDYDIDISYLSKKDNYKDILKEYINICYYFNKNKQLVKENSPGQLHLLTPDKKVAIDFWSSYIIDNKYNLVPIFKNKENIEILPLIEIKFYNQKLYIPKEYEKILIYWYGENWRTPDSNWKGKGKFTYLYNNSCNTIKWNNLKFWENFCKENT